MENNNPKNDRSGRGVTYWIIALLFLLVHMWPVAAVMAVVWLLKGKDSTAIKKAGENIAQTLQQKVRRNPYSSTLSQSYTGTGAHPYTSRVSYRRTEKTAAEGDIPKNTQKGTEKKGTEKKGTEKKGTAAQAADAAPQGNAGRKQRIWGILILLAGLFSAMEPLSQLATLGVTHVLLEDLFQALGLAACGGVLFGVGMHKKAVQQRRPVYLCMIAEKRVVMLEDLANAAGVSPRCAARELQQMIGDSQLPKGTYLDHKRKCLVLDAATMQDCREKEKCAQQKTPEQPRPHTEKNPAQETEYSRILRQIHQANEDIADAEMSAKIDRIEQLSRSIFAILEEKPERRQDARSFFNYYLPTTQKLLDFYAKLEEQPLQQGSIEDSRRNIEGIMDNLVKGFEAQLDSLFRSEALDITTEITVLENMLNRDGVVATPAQQALQQAAEREAAAIQRGAAGTEKEVAAAKQSGGAAVQSAPQPDRQGRNE